MEKKPIAIKTKKRYGISNKVAQNILTNIKLQHYNMRIGDFLTSQNKDFWDYVKKKNKQKVS